MYQRRNDEFVPVRSIPLETQYQGFRQAICQIVKGNGGTLVLSKPDEMLDGELSVRTLPGGGIEFKYEDAS